MNREEVAALLDRYRVVSSKHARLRDHDPADHLHREVAKEAGAAMLTAGVARLSKLQAQLYADGRWALLAVFQAMDAGGKDGTIRHVMSGVNPQGVEVVSFKQPSHEDLAHDFLWRVHRRLPERGHIGILNRSHYEDVLVVRVHPELLHAQRLPGDVGGRKFWRRRLKDIAQFEAYLGRQGIRPLKFFLNVSREEQKKRFLARLEDPDKTWKFDAADLSERARWDDYQAAYEEAIARTATVEAPWYVVPADAKWFAHLVVVEAMIAALEAMDLHVPKLDEAEQAALTEARVRLEAE